MIEPLVKRDDLSQRRALSKSALTGFDACATQSWFDLHYRLPLIPQERITFGSAVDAAVEAAITYLRMEQPIDAERCTAAAQEVVDRDGTEVDLAEVAKALVRFEAEIAPKYDFRLCRLQEHITGELPDLGEVDGHPDVWLADGRIFDVKTAKRPKPLDWSVELGFYALIGQEYSGAPVPSVGYWTYVRSARPYWQIVEMPVTPEWLQWTVERAAAYVRAKRADEVLNAKADVPVNWSMTGGPKYGPSSCVSCQYSVMCPIAFKGNSDDAAA